MVAKISTPIHSLLTWGWTKKLLYWIIISAGTMSECVFLIASLWMSLNSSVHAFMLLFLSEEMTQHISQLATAAYVALPECIVGLAVVTVISHARMWHYTRSPIAATWTILYGLPTIVFLILSLYTLGCSVTSTDFRLPEWMVIIRALSGYMFAFTSLLHAQLGVPQERDRLQQKDVMLAEMQSKMENEIARLNTIISQQNQELQKSKRQQEAMQNEVNKSSEDALHVYSEECKNWLKSGVKTVKVEEVNAFTGHSKRRINAAIDSGKLLLAPRGDRLILVSSLMEWLKQTPAPSDKLERNTSPLLRAVK